MPETSKTTEVVRVRVADPWTAPPVVAVRVSRGVYAMKGAAGGDDQD